MNIEITELENKFTQLNQSLEITNANIGKIQQSLIQEQAKLNQIIGAMKSMADLMVTLVGQEEAQKIIDKIQQKGEKSNE
jgi:septal ring factor EnvC (AmiA/AmiB activator)